MKKIILIMLTLTALVLSSCSKTPADDAATTKPDNFVGKKFTFPKSTLPGFKAQRANYGHQLAIKGNNLYLLNVGEETTAHAVNIAVFDVSNTSAITFKKVVTIASVTGREFYDLKVIGGKIYLVVDAKIYTLTEGADGALTANGGVASNGAINLYPSKNAANLLAMGADPANRRNFFHEIATTGVAVTDGEHIDSADILQQGGNLTPNNITEVANGYAYVFIYKDSIPPVPGTTSPFISSYNKLSVFSLTANATHVFPKLADVLGTAVADENLQGASSLIAVDNKYLFAFEYRKHNIKIYSLATPETPKFVKKLEIATVKLANGGLVDTTVTNNINESSGFGGVVKKGDVYIIAYYDALTYHTGTSVVAVTGTLVDEQKINFVTTKDPATLTGPLSN